MRGVWRTIPLAAFAMVVALAGCSSKSPPREGGSTSSKAEKARKEAESLAVNAVNSAAKAAPEDARRNRGGLFNIVLIPSSIRAQGTKTNSPPPTPGTGPSPQSNPVTQGLAPPVPKTPPRPGPPAVVRERVVSMVPYATEAEAEEDALVQARELVEQKLAALDPPVRHKPSVSEVKAEFIRKDSRTVRPPDAEEKEAFARYGMSGNLVYVEYDVEVTADQVRELRSQERVSAGLRVLGVVMVVALAGFLFLRADEWTKGYLTSWLALGAATLAGGVAAALIFV
jgi:hypothetical protein